MNQELLYFQGSENIRARSSSMLVLAVKLKRVAQPAQDRSDHREVGRVTGNHGIRFRLGSLIIILSQSAQKIG